RPLEAHVVDAGEVHHRVLVGLHAAALERQQRGRLRHRLDDQHAGHDRMMREVTGEERFGHRHVLQRHHALALLHLDHPVDQQEGIAMREILEDFVDVHDDLHSALSLSASFCSRARTRLARVSRWRRWEKFLTQSPCFCRGRLLVYTPGFGIDFGTRVHADTTTSSATVRWPLMPAWPPIRQRAPIFALPATPAQPAIAVWSPICTLCA